MKKRACNNFDHFLIESATTLFTATAVDDEQPGTSGISRRTLRRILKEQQSEDSDCSKSQPESDKPDSSTFDGESDSNGVASSSKRRKKHSTTSHSRKSKDCECSTCSEAVSSVGLLSVDFTQIS